MFEMILKFISDAYALFEQLNLSVAGVIAIAIGLTLALMFAVREMAAWFFKIHDIKHDIRDLRELNTQLEGEIRTLQALVGKLLERDKKTGGPDHIPTQAPPVEIEPQRPEPLQGPSFPIVH